jgi:hypothetical protein
MTEHEASRTLVKSPPELWAECSEAASLARHLGEFGEIRITKLEPETAVAWEGDVARGTVRLEPSGWGTRVILTAAVEQVGAVAEPVVEPGPTAVAEPVVEPEPATGAEPDPQPVAEPEPVTEPVDRGPEVEPAEPERREGFFSRLARRFRQRREFELEALTRPEPREELEPDPEPEFEIDELMTPLSEPEREALAPEPEPEAVVSEPSPEPEPVTVSGAPEPAKLAVESVLSSALDSLGSAHHRPFSRG